MSALDDVDQAWPDDVELDLLLWSARAGGVSALRNALELDDGLAAILAPEPRRDHPDQAAEQAG